MTLAALVVDVLALWVVSKSTASPRATVKTAVLCIVAVFVLSIAIFSVFALSGRGPDLLTGPIVFIGGPILVMYLVMRIYAITFLPALWLVIAVGAVHFVLGTIFPTLLG